MPSAGLVDFTTPYTGGPAFYLGFTTFVRTGSAAGLGGGSAEGLVLGIVSRTASGSGVGSSSADVVLVPVRSGSGSGQGGGSADGVRVAVATGLSSAAGSGSADYLRLVPRTGASAGLGSSDAVRLVISLRGASGSGSGASTVEELLTTGRTASAAGSGVGVASGNRFFQKTAGSSGQGGVVPSAWFKNRIFRPPPDILYPGGNRHYTDVAHRLGSYYRDNVRVTNVYLLTDGTFTRVEQRDEGQVKRIYFGARSNVVNDAEAEQLIAAGYGEYVT